MQHWKLLATALAFPFSMTHLKLDPKWIQASHSKELPINVDPKLAQSARFSQFFVQNQLMNNNALFKTVSESLPMSTPTHKATLKATLSRPIATVIENPTMKLQSLPLVALKGKAMPEWFHKPELKREIMKMKIKSNSLFK